MRSIPLIVAGFFALGLLGLELSYRDTQASPVWLASGLAIAALLRRGERVWPGVWLGEFLVSWLGPGVIGWLGGDPRPLLPAAHVAVIATGSTVAALIAVRILRRCSATGWERTRDLAALLLAATIASVLSGAVGAGVLAAHGAPFSSVFVTWSLGDLIGAVIAAPALLLVHRDDFRQRPSPEAAGIMVALAATILAAVLVPSDLVRPTISYLPLAPLAWAALRLPAGVSAGLLAAWAAAMVAATVAGKGPFTSPGSSLVQVVGFQGYLLAGTAVMHLIALSQRRQELDRAHLAREQRTLAEVRHGLALNEERLRLALQSSGTGLWDWDLINDTAHFSRSWMTMLGYDPDELPATGATWRSLLHPEDLPVAERALADHLAGAAPMYRAEFRLRRKDGGWAWILTCGQVVDRTAEGRPARIVGTHVDITALKQAEAARAAEARRAEEAARAKSEFLATMSHEIRTPMNGVIGMVSVLEDTPLTEEQREMVTTIRSSGEVLMTVLNDILDLSKIEAGKLEVDPQPVRVLPAVSEVADLFRAAAEAKGLALDVACDGDPWVRADPHRLRQALLNLLSNAIKFTESGRVAISAAPGDGCCRIAVRDTGIGIPPEAMHRLFQPFSQVDASTTRRYGGTGLGLAISRRLVEAMGGGIAVESATGGGSCFTVELASCAPPAAAPGSPGAPGASRARRVLLAEDQPVNQRVATLLLRRLGLEVVVAADGEEALQAWRAGPFDLLLLDLQMPVMDGFAAARAIRREERELGRPRMPIAALTANALPADRLACREAGMDDLLPKPITRESVAGLLAALAPAH